MQKITPHLWYDTQAVEAAELYTATFPNSRINFQTTISDVPSGDSQIVAFTILDYNFMAISAGPYFQLNPAISFHIKCLSVEEVDRLWERLSPGGMALMELGEYPFSKRFGWLQDRYGVSWQIILDDSDPAQRVRPVLMFTQAACGRAEEALNYYAQVFPGSQVQIVSRHEAGDGPDAPGTLQYGQWFVAGQEFGAMDSAHAHAFTFNEAVSLMVSCRDQAEIDYYWERLSTVPESEQCGWCKDQFGVSWQIIPENLSELMGRNPAKTTPVLLAMKKLIIADLEAAGAE